MTCSSCPCSICPASHWDQFGTYLTPTTTDLGVILNGSTTISHNLTVGTSTTFFVDSGTGRVGINTAVPEALLHVSGGDILLDNEQQLTWKTSGGTIGDVLNVNASDNVFLGSAVFDDLVFKVGTLGEAMRIKEISGHIGIGTVSPTELLTVTGGGISTNYGISAATGTFSNGFISSASSTIIALSMEISTTTGSLVIPVDQTVDTVGEVKVDTTEGQFVYVSAGGESNVVSATSSASFAFELPVDGDQFHLWKVPYDITITDINCLTRADDGAFTGIDLDLFESDSSGNSTTTIDGAITCNDNGGTDDNSFTNPTIDAGDWIGAYFGNASGTASWVTITFPYKIDTK